ncbi:phosphoglycolate phosphatase [Aliiroseovarius crassostreae]|uniref:phosphoglycolate phosphatase n=1 Tax=Aliiroseovarius crassostreae TaxID=154981 RepID=A0A0P7KKY3_9RHOB|nr:HAD-IA family hydrolase [Aliiroseovarius crassostreae]KPN62591.1 haloacid dehalogenase [Aliiroseovarius crassostreae]SFU54721.1 phosphoglycolate phosphatase [Aliiroseovarius crassostreae]
MQTVIFDLDGTLADTSGDLIAAANACFQALGLGQPLDPVADALTAFHGGRAMLHLGFERLGHGDVSQRDPHVEREFPNLLDHYRIGIDRHTRLYPGAVAAVKRLRAQGYAVGICTNKPEGLADLLLVRLGIRDLFTSLIGADTLPTRKPDPAPYVASVEQAGGRVEASLIIGDTMTDRETARAAGVPCILVGFGPEGQGVSRLAPEAMLDHFDHLDDIVAWLIGQPVTV